MPTPIVKKQKLYPKDMTADLANFVVLEITAALLFFVLIAFYLSSAKMFVKNYGQEAVKSKYLTINN